VYVQFETVVRARTSYSFVWSATYALREAVNATAEQVEYGVDKFKKAGLKK